MTHVNTSTYIYILTIKKYVYKTPFVNFVTIFMVTALLEKLTGTHPAKNLPPFTKSKDSLQSSQQFANGSYPQPDDSSTHPRDFVTSTKMVCFKQLGR
jgi:hypothetical protein